MPRKTFHQKVKNINDWIEIFNHYWVELEGQYHDKKQFWDDTLHSMTNEDWWDVVEAYPTLHDLHEDLFREYGYIKNDIDTIERRLMLGKPVVKPSVKNWNFPAFHAMVVLKDVLNSVNGVKLPKFDKPQAHDDTLTPFENLFDVK